MRRLQRFFALAFVLTGFVASTVVAQSRFLGPSESTVRTNFVRQQQKYRDLAKAEIYYNEALHKDVVEAAADFLVYQVTWLSVLQQGYRRPARARSQLENIREKFANEMKQLELYADKNEAFRKAFGKALVERFEKILLDEEKFSFRENRLAHVNAGLMLSDLGRVGTAEVGDFLFKLMTDKKTHPAIQMFAVRGMGELFPAKEFIRAKGEEAKARRDREIRYVEELLSRLTSKSKHDKAVTHYLRREVIRALAKARIPAVEVSGGKAQGAVAEGLLRVLSKSPGLTPPPSFKEKIEAAIGIGHIKVANISPYKPDWGIALLARFVHEFAEKCKAENFANKEYGSVPWKAYGAKLRESVKQMPKNIPPSPSHIKAQDKARNFYRIADKVLEAIEQGNPDRIRGFQVQQLLDAANKYKPDDQQIYRGVGKTPFKLD